MPAALCREGNGHRALWTLFRCRRCSRRGLLRPAIHLLNHKKHAADDKNHKKGFWRLERLFSSESLSHLRDSLLLRGAENSRDRPRQFAPLAGFRLLIASAGAARGRATPARLATDRS